jgi:hypothetical protein
MTAEALIKLFCQGALFALNLFLLWKKKEE